jgi:hypothetical protein
VESKQSLKKFFFMLGTWFVVIIAVIGGSILYDRYKTSEFDGSDPGNFAMESDKNQGLDGL